MTVQPTKREMQRGYGNAERPLNKVLWERDSRGLVAATASEGNHDPDRPHVDFKRYYDPAFAAEEIEKIFLKTWLQACREEDLPNVGDKLPFECGRLSFIIVRSSEDEFKAFYNSCLHRGTKLCSKKENTATMVCPFHAWEWNNDGSLRYIPSHWDFRSIDRRNGNLKEVRVGRWGGIVWINADPDAPELMEALGPLPEHFAGFRLEDRYTAAWFRKNMQANWKTCMEAFMESYHVIGTHPGAVPYNGDSQSQYDIWSSDTSCVGRNTTPSAVPSMLAPADATPLVAAMVFAQIMIEWHFPNETMPQLDPAKDLRAQVAQWHREVQQRAYGWDQSEVSDAVMIDSPLYWMFPHTGIWLSEPLPFLYRFTPHPTDPNQCYFEVRMLMPIPEGAERPPPCERVDLDSTEFAKDKAPAFGFLATVFDEDMSNMPLIQAGMHAAARDRHHSLLGTYQEQQIQHWHDEIDKYLAR